jgi:HK97 family phage portal protein
MGLISETRTSLENPQTPLSYPAEWLLDIFNGGRTDSGIRVSEMTALQVSTIWACIEIKAGAIGYLDPKIFEHIINDDGRLQRRVAHEHSYWEVLAHEPNPEMSSFTLRKTVQAHRMLWGNGYIELQRDGAGRLIAMWPRNPARIRPHRVLQRTRVVTSDGITTSIDAGKLVYVTTEGMETESMDPENPSPDPQGPHGERYIVPEDILHIPGLSLDGRIGQSVIQMARNAIGLALATEKFGSKFFGNGAVGMGIFKLPGNLSPEDYDTFKREVHEAWGGENMHRPMVLEGGEDYKQTSTDPDKAQAIQTREHQVIEICRIFTTPPHMIGVVEKTSRANTEQIGQEFVTFSLGPDLKAWEQEIGRKLFPPPSLGRNAGKKFGVFFDTRPLTMPSANDLRQFIQAMIQWGVFEPNDALELLRMNPRPGKPSDCTWMQINMAPTDQLYETPALPSNEPTDQPDDDQEDKPAAKDDKGKAAPGKRNEMLVVRMSRVYSRLFRDAFGRIAARSDVDLAVFQRTFLPLLTSIGEEFEQLAAAQFNAEPDPDGLESSSFLAEYLRTMHHRYKNEAWRSANGRGAEICDRELQRAVRSLAVEIYRNAATRRAKEETEVIPS